MTLTRSRVLLHHAEEEERGGFGKEKGVVEEERGWERGGEEKIGRASCRERV